MRAPCGHHFRSRGAAGRPTAGSECGCPPRLCSEPARRTGERRFPSSALVLILCLSQHLTLEKALYLFRSPSAPLWAEGADHWFQAPHQGRHARRMHSSPRGDCGPTGGDVRPGAGALDQRAPGPFLLQHGLSLIDCCRHMDGGTHMNLWMRYTFPVGTRGRRGSGQQDGHTFICSGRISLFWSLGTWAGTRVLLCVLRWGLAARG